MSRAARRRTRREGRDHVERSGEFLVATLARRYPVSLPVPAMPPVGRTDRELCTVLRLRRLSTPDALHRVQRERQDLDAQRRDLDSQDHPRATSLGIRAEGMRELEADLLSRRTRLWELTLGLRGGGPGRAMARRGLDGTRRDLEAQGFRFHPADHQAGPHLRALEPGGPEDPELPHPLPEEGVAALLPLWEDQAFEPLGTVWGLHARDGTPVSLDRFRHPSHSSAIFGQTGAGKSYASALGWMRARWTHPDLSIFVLDPLGGLAQVAHRLGGTLVRPGEPGFLLNPLDPRTTGGDRQRKASRVGAMFRALFPSLTDEEVASLDLALSRLYAEHPNDAPLLEDLLGGLGRLEPVPHRLRTLMRPALEGSLRHLNAPTSISLDGRIFGFDLSGIAPGELPFFLVLVLDYVLGEVRVRAGPKLVVLDEAHYLARDPATAQLLDHLVRHVRHYRGGIELVSQNPADFLATDAGRSILLNLDTVLLLRLKDGGEAVAPLLQLAPEEVAYVKRAAMPGETGHSQGLLRWGDRHLPISVLASPEEDEFLRRAFAGEGADARPPCPGGARPAGVGDDPGLHTPRGP